MRIVIVFESSYGNTHRVADAVADGLRAAHDVTVVPVAHAAQETVAGADLIVVGGPTHIHGMSRPTSRSSAATAAERPGGGVALDPDAGDVGVREWLGTVHGSGGWAAAFDTRLDGAPVLTGRAAKGIAHLLRRAGFRLLTSPMSFLVTKTNEMVPGQLAAAQQWGESLAVTLAAEAARSS